MIKYVIAFLLISTGLFGYLSYHFYGDKVEAESALVQVIDANTELTKSLNLQVKSCEISDTITSEYQSEKQVQQDKTQVTVRAIDKLPSKPQKVVKDEVSDVVDIDGKLPSELISLLSKASDSNQRGSNPDAK